MKHRSDVILIGAGQAGLVASHGLSREGISHIVLERGAIGESWRSQRWDSFCLNTPNWSNGLPGMDFHPEAPDAFARGSELVRYFEGYVARNGLPVRENTPVTSLKRLSEGGFSARSEDEEFVGRAAIVASGGASTPRVPPMAGQLSPEILSLSAGTYRNPGSLPDGGVLVVGSAQSGCQIAEDLLEAGRRVYLSVSRVARAPRTYRGRDILGWFRDLGVLDVRLNELQDPALQFAAQPQVSGTHGGHTVSLQSLARDGAVLLGRVVDAAGSSLRLEPTVREAVAFADDRARAFKSDIDQYISRNGLAIEAAGPDPGEPALPDLNGSDARTDLDLRRAGIATVIWCTGFGADWSWLQVDVLDERGQPRHCQGVSDTPGLYFLGLPWLSKRKSGILYGVAEDAERVVEDLLRYLG